jgi:flagellar basal body-associated protein FliL
MKKGLMTIIIVAITLVNLVLTSILIFTVVPTMNSTARVVKKISNLIDLETTSQDTTNVPIDRLEVYNIEEKLTVSLQSTDGKAHYAVVYTSLYLNTQNADYKKYASSISDKEAIIKSDIINIVSKYTMEQIRDDQDKVTDEILAKLREEYNSDFIYKVVFSNVTLQ